MEDAQRLERTLIAAGFIKTMVKGQKVFGFPRFKNILWNSIAPILEGTGKFLILFHRDPQWDYYILKGLKKRGYQQV